MFLILHISGVFKIGRWEDINFENDARLKELSAKLPNAIYNSKAENTLKNYNYGFKAWCSWCKMFSIEVIPASDYHVSLYIVYLMQTSCSISKVEAAVYSIGWAHEIAGFANPCDSFLVKSVTEGARRQLSPPLQEKRTYYTRNTW